MIHTVPHKPRPGLVALAIAVLAAMAGANVFAQGGRAGAPAGPPPTAQAAPRFDPTGYWVAIVSEDWRHRMFTPPKGDVQSVPVNPAGRAAAAAWDPAKDEAAGEQCKAYGAAGIMRLPTRLHITWQDANTLKIETDLGMQTRLLHFGRAQGEGGDWQGVSVANWDIPAGPIPGRGRGVQRGGALKVVTTRMKPGYLRRNGVPYSANTVMTEYFNRFDVPGGDSLLVVSTEIVDPEYLATPYWTSPNFKRQSDASGWNPTPCSAR